MLAIWNSFMKGLKRAIEKLGLKSLVKLYLRNLSEAESGGLFVKMMFSP